MFSIGLTGGIGSGKTTVADLFAAHGVPVIDTDLIAHRITAPGGVAMPLIASQFGPEFVAGDGSLNRAKMRERVFADGTAKARLEAITHPLIRAETERQRSAARGAYHIVVVPLLVEGGKPGVARGAGARRRLPRRDADRARHAPQRLLARAGARDHRAPGDARSAPRGGGRHCRQRRPRHARFAAGRTSMRCTRAICHSPATRVQRSIVTFTRNNWKLPRTATENALRTSPFGVDLLG